MRIVTYLIEYLSNFIFKNILDYESGDQMDSFDAKKLPWKISCLGTFKVGRKGRKVRKQEWGADLDVERESGWQEGGLCGRKEGW
jgi:hypothetical protein